MRGLGQAADCPRVSLSPARSPHMFSSSCAALLTASTPSLSCGSLMTLWPWPSSSSPSTSSWRSAGPGDASSSGEGLGSGGGCPPWRAVRVNKLGTREEAVLGPGAAWAPTVGATAVMQLPTQPGCIREDEHPALRTRTSLPPPPTVWSLGLYPQALHLCTAPGGSLLETSLQGQAGSLISKGQRALLPGSQHPVRVSWGLEASGWIHSGTSI